MHGIVRAIIIIGLFHAPASFGLDDALLLRHGYSRWNNNEAVQHGQPSDTLVAFTAANVGHRTTAFLASLAATTDSFDLLAVDEHSSDNTAQDLVLHGVRTLRAEDNVGVTALWNMAYQHYLQHGYDKLIYSNNDVLVPNGVIDKLRHALDKGCDLVSPLSTINGKGHVGKEEGMEVLFNLSTQAAKMVNNPGNFGLVQHLLDNFYHDQQGHAPLWKGRHRFNGFFFALSSRIKAAAYAEDLLFNPRNFNLDQVCHTRAHRVTLFQPPTRNPISASVCCRKT